MRADDRRRGEDDTALGQCYGSALAGRDAFDAGAGRPAGRLRRLVRDAPTEVMEASFARTHGFNLHANVTVRAADRGGLERLCSYLTRPALSHRRLQRLDDEFH
ncbi:MAG: hypothetical protein ACJAYU_002738 [Bradymonadia bacterium]|jgi:hypothetical protein